MENANPRAVIGANNPPDPIDTITAPFDDARAEAENWTDGTPVENEAQMNTVDALRKDMRTWRLELEAGQKTATAPLHEVYKAELARWKPVIEDAKRIEGCLVAVVDGFKRKLASEKEAARKKAEDDAWEAGRAAREAHKAAADGDLEAQRLAAAAMADAEAKQRLAMAAKNDVVKGLRWYDCHEILDHRAALHWIAANDRDAMTAFIEAYVAKNATRFPPEVVRNYREQRAQ